MKTILLKVMIILCCVVNLIYLYAQEETDQIVVTSDFESWSSFTFKTKFSKQFSMNLEQGFRFNRNSSELDQALTEINFTSELPSNFRIGAGFRYIKDQSKNNSFDNDFRFNIDASYNNKINRLKYKIRLRYQNKNEIGYSIEEGDEFKSFARAKLSLEYNIKNWKLDPRISTETFRSLRSDGQFEKYRFTIGTNYNLKKMGEFGIFYRIENELNTNYPKTTYIAGINYTYTFKSYKK